MSIGNKAAELELGHVEPRNLAKTLWHSPRLRALGGAFIVAALILFVRQNGWLQRAELSAYDGLVVSAAQPAISSHVALVGIDEADINRFHFPLSDDFLADLLQRIASWHPRVIGVDVYRDMPVQPDSGRLAAVLKQNPNIVWVFGLADSGDASHREVLPPQELRGTDRVALVDVLTDPGGTTRRGLLYADNGQESFPGLGLALALQYLAADKIGPTAGPDDALKLGPTVIPPLDSHEGPYVELDARGYQTILDYHGGAAPFRRATVAAVMDQDLSALFQGKAVIIGGVAQTVKDSYATPFTSIFGNGSTDYGMEIHAEVADQLIREALGQTRLVKGLGRGEEGLWILGWAIAGATLGLAIRAALPGLAVGTLGFFVIAGVVVFAFRHGLLLPGVPAALSWASAAALTNQVLYAASNRARARLRAAFERYLPPPVVKQMLDADALPQLRGERREISVLFTDVAGFTTFSEGRDPVELARLTNDYFERICAAVFAHGGLVNAFIGDSVLAFFGAPVAQPDHADRAIDAALEIDRAARIFVEEQFERGVKFGITRVGVHMGPAFVGNVGSRDRLQYTALGDTLNCGSRLEGVNKVIGTRVCASGEILDRAERHQWRPVGSVVVAGRDQPIDVFTPLDGQQAEWEGLYQAAFAAADARCPEAPSLFAALYRDHPDDPCVSFHHRRLSNGAEGTLIIMDTK